MAKLTYNQTDSHIVKLATHGYDVDVRLAQTVAKVMIKNEQDYPTPQDAVQDFNVVLWKAGAIKVKEG